MKWDLEINVRVPSWLSRYRGKVLDESKTCQRPYKSEKSKYISALETE